MDKWDISQNNIESLENQLNDRSVLIFSFGSIEPAGKYLPLGTDLLIANSITPLIANKSKCFYLPTVPFGDTLEMSKDSYKIHIKEQVLNSYCLEAVNSLSTKFNKIIFISYHSLNNIALNNVCRKLKDEGTDISLIDWWKVVGTVGKPYFSDTPYPTGHGSEMITSVMMALKPELVNLPKEKVIEPKKNLPYYLNHLPNGTSPCWVYGNFDDYSSQTTWGNLEQTNIAKGEKLISLSIDYICSFIETFKDLKRSNK